MRTLSKFIVTGAGIAAISLTAVGMSSAESANPAVTSTTKGVVTSLTTTHTQPLLSATKTATLHKDTRVEIRCWIDGQVVGGSDKWFMLAGGLGFGPRAAIQPDSAVPACV